MTDAPVGLECPDCGGTAFSCTSTDKSADYGGAILRYKKCRSCGANMKTVELPAWSVEHLKE